MNVADEEFRHPRLAAIYDALDPDRSDLDLYVQLVEELGVNRVLDVGCGTGTLALMLAERGCDVIGVDPAAASLAVARAKSGAQRVRWIHGDVSAVHVADRDLAVMTANVAQAITDASSWYATLQGIHHSLRPEGYLVFETRNPAAEGWKRWNLEDTYAVAQIAGVGGVTSWTEVTSIEWPLVTFRSTWIFDFDGQTLTSESTLRFRQPDEIEADLISHGYSVLEVRDAPDRPDLEFVYLAVRGQQASLNGSR